MQFIGAREFRSKGREQWRALRSGEEAVPTLNDAPIAVLVDVPDGRLEDTLRPLRRARSGGGRTHTQAGASRGLDRMSQAKVKAEVLTARREHH